MGQKITEFPQVDYWVKLTREADKAGATLPQRGSSDRKELSQFGEMQRARFKSSFSVVLPASMTAHIDPDETTKEEVANDDAPGSDDEAEEAEGEDDGETASA